MVKRVSSIVLVVLFLSWFSTTSAFSQARNKLTEELNQVKEDYYSQKYEIDNQVRDLSREWHLYQLEMYKKIKDNPEEAKAIRAQIWQSAKELSQKKEALYDQLTPLRKSWYSQRMKLEGKIDTLDTLKKAQWN